MRISVRLWSRLAFGALVVALTVGILAGELTGSVPSTHAIELTQSGNPVEDLITAGIVTGEALVRQAELRRTQAQSGQGGLGARAEDIIAAEAEVIAAKVALRLRQPFDDLRFLQGPILLADGAARAAGKLADACGEQEAEVEIEVNGNKLDAELEIDINCPDDLQDSLEAARDVAIAARTSAELELKKYTTPASTIQNFVTPFEQQVKQTTLEVDKLKSGGIRDETTLQLNSTLAQADLDTLKAIPTGSAELLLRAQLGGASAERDEARLRLEQAQQGQGGKGVRPQDIAQSESEVISTVANLQLLLNPLAEDVGQARAALDGAKAAVRAADKLAEACGDLEVDIKLKQDKDKSLTISIDIPIDIPIFPGLPPIHIDLLQVKIKKLKAEMDLSCSGDKRRMFEAVTDAARAVQTIAEQQVQVLTNPTQPQILNVIEPKAQAVVAAQARLQKLKTGGIRDLTTLQLELARAEAAVSGLEALLAGSPGAFVAAQLQGAQAALGTAEARIQQANAGQGGVDARAEDIAIAAADLAAREAELRQIIDPQPELIAAARANVTANEALVRKAEFEREACSGPMSKTDLDLVVLIKNLITNKEEEVKKEKKTKSYTSCSDDLKDALEAEIKRARKERDVARVQLAALTAPSPELIQYLVGPAQQAIVIATARLQKLKSGGSQDSASLERNLALAQSEVDFWQAVLAGSASGQVEAQLRAARANQKLTEYRAQQAKAGQGGADARPEDIAEAEAQAAIAVIALTAVVKPAPEKVLIAESQASAAAFGIDAAKHRREACDDPRTVAIADDDNNNDDNGNRSVTAIHCDDDLGDALEAEVDRARALLDAAEQNLKLLTNPAMPQILHVIAPYQQAVVAAQARVQKLKTGGSRDQATLELNVAQAGAEVARLEAVLTGDRSAELNARLAGAQAGLREADFRVQQAASGQGGRDARAEDIAIAEALFIAAKERLLGVLDLPLEVIAIAQADLAAADASVRAAEGYKRSCGDVDLITRTKIHGVEREQRAVTRIRCSDDKKESLEWGVEQAARQRDIAVQKLKLLVNPAMPQVLNLLALYQGPVEAAGAYLQKEKTGGSQDQVALQLDLAVAQAEVARWQAAMDGSPRGEAVARLSASEAGVVEADARQAQVAAGQGGPHVRPEDVAIAAADLKIRTGSLNLLLDPLQEIVQGLRLAVAVNDAAEQKARFTARACGDQKFTTSIVEGEDDDGDPNELPIQLKIDTNCPDDQRDALEAITDGIHGFRLVPAAALSLVTELCCNEKLQVLVTGKKAEVTVAEQRLKKLSTGGPDDASLIELRVDLARALVACRQAVVGLTDLGGLPPQTFPFAWADPDPCALGQLPGKVPPFTQQDVRPFVAGATLAVRSPESD